MILFWISEILCSLQFRDPDQEKDMNYSVMSKTHNDSCTAVRDLGKCTQNRRMRIEEIKSPIGMDVDREIEINKGENAKPICFECYKHLFYTNDFHLQLDARNINRSYGIDVSWTNQIFDQDFQRMFMITNRNNNDNNQILTFEVDDMKYAVFYFTSETDPIKYNGFFLYLLPLKEVKSKKSKYIADDKNIEKLSRIYEKYFNSNWKLYHISEEEIKDLFKSERRTGLATLFMVLAIIFAIITIYILMRVVNKLFGIGTFVLVLVFLACFGFALRSKKGNQNL